MIKSIDKYQTIGMIGLSKNTGKTTTLNYYIELFKHEKIGITSIGLDGEAIDQINFLPKPQIYVFKGMFVATAEACLDDVELQYEVIEETPYLTALGRVLLIRIKDHGHLVVAGPSSNKEMNGLLSLMKKYVNRIFVDGALSRMTFSAISELDAIVLATGAAFSPSMEETIQKTKHIVTLFQYPKTKIEIDEKASFIISTQNCEQKQVIKRYDVIKNELLHARKDIRWIYIKGAITERLMDILIDLRISHIKLIADDPTKFLFHYRYMQVFLKLGIEVEVMKVCPLIMITVNPYRPTGSSYDPITFENRIRDITDIPVINVKHLEDQKWKIN